ncbi:hypothetical protein HPC50_16880 [Corallococcus exiguus]|uniref:hypothetical protein n=1 Tax=Corallococcus TaxID=83461 RepID=UPI0011C48F72|nr:MULTISPECIES: hypothetical protein [Corallococcus]NPC48735.1 hypothetical protein [Corallococcus exiguus]
MSKMLKGLLAAVLLVGCGGTEADVDSPAEFASREDAIYACNVGAAPYSLCNGGNGVCVYPSASSGTADCRPKCGVACGTSADECCIGYAPLNFCEMSRGCGGGSPGPVID